MCDKQEALGWGMWFVVMVGTHSVAANCTAPFSVMCSVHSVVACSYVHCLVFVVAVLSAGQSMFYYRYIEQVAFQFVHAHVGGMLLTMSHKESPCSTVVLAAVMMIQAHKTMCIGITNIRRNHRGVPANLVTWSLRLACVAAYVVCDIVMQSCLHEVCAQDTLGDTVDRAGPSRPRDLYTGMPLSFSALGEKVLTAKIPAVLAFAPDIVFAIASQARVLVSNACVS
jgi:hypothetical protein